MSILAFAVLDVKSYICYKIMYVGSLEEKPMSKAIKYPEVYTVEEFAEIFKVSPESVRNLIRKGEISAIKIGKQYRISKTVVDRYFAQVATPEELGFGMWKEAPVDSLEYVNKLRDKDKRTPEKFLEDVRSGNSG